MSHLLRILPSHQSISRSRHFRETPKTPSLSMNYVNVKKNEVRTSYADFSWVHTPSTIRCLRSSTHRPSLNTANIKYDINHNVLTTRHWNLKNTPSDLFWYFLYLHFCLCNNKVWLDWIRSSTFWKTCSYGRQNEDPDTEATDIWPAEEKLICTVDSRTHDNSK